MSKLRNNMLLILVAVIIVVIYFYNDLFLTTIEGEYATNPDHKTMIDKKERISIPSLMNEDRVIAKQIRQMSLDEKIGQMIFGGFSGTTLNEQTKTLINTYKLGGLIFFANNITNTEQTTLLINEIKAENRSNNIPLLLGIDQEGGRVERLPDELSKLPTNKHFGEQNDKKLSYNVGVLLGKQLNAFGFNLNFAPVLDVNTNKNNPVIGDRSFGEDPLIVRELGRETMRGMQSENIIPVLKHFPGHGDTSVDSHVGLPVINKQREQLDEIELIPFKHAIDDGADMIMTAHILLAEIDPDNPATLSKMIITYMLREELGFEGVVITDDMTMQAIANKYSMTEASVKAVEAGSDLILIAHGYDAIASGFNGIISAVESGEITEERINESVARILRLKGDYAVTNERIIENLNIKRLNDEIDSILDN